MSEIEYMLRNIEYMDKLKLLQKESDKWASKDYAVHLLLNSVLLTVEEIMQSCPMESTLFKKIVSASVRQFIIKKLEREHGKEAVYNKEDAVYKKVGELYKFIEYAG